MKFLNNSEELVLTSYLNMKEAKYIIDLNIRYDMEYYDILALKMLNNCSNLGFKIEDFDSDIKNDITEYANNSNNFDNKIHFMLSEIVIYIAKKYYNDDGTLKNNNRIDI